MKKLLIVLSILSLLTVVSFAQGTTGELHGVVKTADGQVIPGAVVTAMHKSGMKKIAISSENGKFKLANLTPGVYTVSVELEGFKKSIQTNVKINLSKVTSIIVDLNLGAIKENITVEGKAATVDIVNSSTSTNVDKDFFDALPKGRGYASFVMMAPSVQADRFGQSFGGATGVENMFVVDGINVTDIETGGMDKTTNVVYEFIEEVEVKTGGYEAEYAGALGGVVNIITKSGGNEFHGSVIANYASEMFVGERKITYLGSGAIDGMTRMDLGLGLGGYIMKDKVWFFAAATPSYQKQDYNTVNALTNEALESDTTWKTYNFSAKLTFSLGKNHVINLSTFGDPRKTTGGNAGTMNASTRDYKSDISGGTYNFTSKYEGSFGSDLYVSVLVGQYRNKVVQIPLSGDKDTPLVIYDPGNPQGFPAGYRDGGYGYMSDPNESTRITLKADITKFFGSHTLKLGFNMYKSTLDSNDIYTGGFYNQYRSTYARQRYRTTDGKSNTNVMALYFQDSISIGRLHLNIGLRAESQLNKGTDTNTVYGPDYAFFDWGFGDMLAPRLGFSYDVFGDFTTKIFGSYARYFEMVPMDINSRTFGHEINYYNYYRYPVDGSLHEDVNPKDPFYVLTLGTGETPIQPDIKPPYQEEFILGVERQLSEDISVSVRGVFKKLGRMVEDGSFDGGSTYFMFNPGEWTPTDLHIPDWYSTIPEEYRQFPVATREYKAIEVVLKKRFSNNYQFTLSYTYANAEGNINGLAIEEYGQVDPNITATFDFPDILHNYYGKLPTSIAHAFKFDGSYAFDFGLNIGLSLRARTGRPYTDMAENDGYGLIAFLDPRGSSGELPSMFTSDVHLSYMFKLGSNMKLSIFTDIFNITNNTKMTRMNTYYDSDNYYGYSFYGEATTAPPWTKPASPSYEHYGKATAYNAPIRATFGIKLQF